MAARMPLDRNQTASLHLHQHLPVAVRLAGRDAYVVGMHEEGCGIVVLLEQGKRVLVQPLVVIVEGENYGPRRHRRALGEMLIERIERDDAAVAAANSGELAFQLGYGGIEPDLFRTGHY